MSQSSYDVVVVGAGVMGCSIAYALARRGLEVLAVDRGPGAGSGSTSASSACIRFNYSHWAGVATAWESMHAWQDWEGLLRGHDEAGMAHFIRTGGLAFDTPAQSGAQVAALYDRAGVTYEQWDADTLRRRAPMFDPGCYYPPHAVDDDAFFDDPHGSLSACFTPDSGYVDDPQLAAHNLMWAAQQAGATFAFRTGVVAVEHSAGRVGAVGLSTGESARARVVVNAAGPHSGVINAMAGLDASELPTRPLRQEVHEVAAPAGYGFERDTSGTVASQGPVVGDLDLGIYLRSTPSGGILVGGTEPECDPLQWLADPDDYQPGASPELHRAQVYRAARRIPDLTVPNTPRGIAGVYDVTPDWTPIYDKTSLAGFYVAIGTSGNQFKNAPIVGEIMASIIEANEGGTDTDQVPVQLTLHRTQNTVDLSAYGRLRPIGEDEPHSVMG